MFLYALFSSFKTFTFRDVIIPSATKAISSLTSILFFTFVYIYIYIIYYIYNNIYLYKNYKLKSRRVGVIFNKKKQHIFHAHKYFS